MKVIKKAACAILSAVLAVGALTGCSTDPSGAANLPAGETSIPGETARGRYIETEIELPESLQDSSLINFTREKDGTMNLFARIADASENTVFINYSYDGSKWTEKASRWGQDLIKQGLSISHIAYGPDGFYYAGVCDTDYIYHLYRIEENGSATELLSDIFKPGAGEEYGLSPNSIAVNSSGQILISSSQEAFLYKPDGTRLSIFPQSFSGDIDFQTMAFTDEEYITVMNHELVRYSLSNGTVLENIPLDFLNGAAGSPGVIFTDQNGGIYIANESGLFHRSQDGTIWETVMEGSLTSLAMKNLYLNSFTEGMQNDYYGVFVGEMAKGIRLFHYTYDPDMAAVPPLVLSVYALKDNSSVRQAASVFQKENPEYRVDFRVAMQDGNDSIKDDIIRALNTELVNGKGADVLILDGLPADSYEEKGVLLDIRDTFADINRDVPFLDIIPKQFMNEDGSIYYMPARITFPVILGEEEALNAFASLSSMRTFKDEKQLFQMVSYENLLRVVAGLHYSEIFGKDMENLTQEMLTNYLETVKELGEGRGLTPDGEWVPLKIASNAPSNVFSNGINNDDFNFDKGITACSLNEFASIFSTIIPWALLDKHTGTEFRTVNGVYFPKLLTGINQASGQKEAAVKFLKILYSTEIQSIEFDDGFPVLKEALDSWADIDKEISLAITDGEGYELSAEWPDRERREKVIHLVDSLTEAVWMDETVMEMIINGSAEYFNGTQTAEQVSNAISRKISLYLAE